jgi:hypothetical protein
MTMRRHAMTEKKSDAKREFHCACATGDLSAIEPVVAPPADETTAKPVEPSKPAAAVAPGAVDQHKTRG